MRILFALLATVALAALAAASAGAVPVRADKLTKPEQRWARPVVKVWNTMNAGLLVVSKQTTASQALVPGTTTNAALVQTLSAFVGCSGAMARAKDPPSSRLVPVANAMKSACAHLATGAHGVANGIATIYRKRDGKLGAAQIKLAFKQFQLGSSDLATARKQLLAIGGKKVFVA